MLKFTNFYLKLLSTFLILKLSLQVFGGEGGNYFYLPIYSDNFSKHV